MRRKRRQSDKESQQIKIPYLPKREIPKHVSEPVSFFTIPEIAQEYTKFLQQQVSAPKEKPEPENRPGYIEDILTNLEQFYKNIRAPVNVIENFLQYVENAVKNSKINDTVLNTARQELTNIENLLLYLLLVWTPKIPTTEINIHTILQAELTRAIKSFRSRKITVRTDFAETPHILCSPDLMALCTRNILSNIVESAPAQSEIKIQTGIIRDQTRANVEILFIHPVQHNLSEAIEKAFTLFYTTKQSHLGIGLSLCREIMHSMNGEITLQLEHGSAVQTLLRFPMHQV